MSPLKTFHTYLRTSTMVEFDLLIDPELAILMLRRNTRNRQISRSSVLAHTKEMLSDSFETLADGIAFDTHGILIDGQQRLLAIIEAKKSATLRVAFGLDPNARIAVDVRSRVSDGELLEIAGLSHGDMRASVARMYRVHVNGVGGHASGKEIEGVARELQVELDALANYYPALSRLGIRAPLLCALALGLRKAPVETASFIDRLINRQRSGANDPVTKFEDLAEPVKGRRRDDLLLSGLRCIRAALSGETIERVRAAADEVRHFLPDAKAALSAA